MERLRAKQIVYVACAMGMAIGGVSIVLIFTAFRAMP